MTYIYIWKTWRRAVQPYGLIIRINKLCNYVNIILLYVGVLLYYNNIEYLTIIYKN